MLSKHFMDDKSARHYGKIQACHDELHAEVPEALSMRIVTASILERVPLESRIVHVNKSVS